MHLVSHQYENILKVIFLWFLMLLC